MAGPSLWAGAITARNDQGQVYVAPGWWAAEAESQARAMAYDYALTLCPPPEWRDHKVVMEEVPGEVVSRVYCLQRMRRAPVQWKDERGSEDE